MFQRRTRLALHEKGRELVWPSMGWPRVARYAWTRVKRIRATPHSIALGVAFGVFASFTPFKGLHIAISLFLAYLFGGNLISAALGTLVGNPATFPVIWVATYELGVIFIGPTTLGMDPVFEAWSQLIPIGALDQIVPALVRMAAGAVPLGFLAAVICYVPVRMGVAGFQRSRAHWPA